MKNKYEIRGDVTTIYLNRDLETIISTSDLDKVDSHPGTWGAYPGGHGKFYVQSKIPGTRKHMKLARFILDEPDGLVDHRNGDTLNNTRGNLRESDEQQNRYNTGLNSNNSSGYKGVTFSQKEGKWKAQIWYNGKNIFLGYHLNRDDAVKARQDAERMYVK